MNRPIFTVCLLTFSIAVGSTVAARGQTISSHQLIHGTRCDHVLHLIHRYGVNNSVNCVGAHSLVQHSPLGPLLVDGNDFGDLVISQVSQVVDDDAGCGPRFAIMVTNQSCRKICNLHVSAVGVLGRIFPHSPSSTVCVAEIGAGETLQVDITLPIEALAMGNRNGVVIGLQRLVVAIDSYDQFVETNEANNLKAFAISEIPVLAPAVETVSETTAVEQPAAVQPAAVVDQASVDNAALAVTGNSPAVVAPQGESSSQRLRQAIEKLANDSAQDATASTTP